jgi:hypothetical protein
LGQGSEDDVTSKPDVVIHIGPMKTGTTALGYYFSVATELGILPRTIIYPTGDLWFNPAGRIVKHNALFDFFAGDSDQPQFRKTAIQQPADVESRVARAAAAATQVGSETTVVYISETLSGRKGIDKLLTMLRKYFGSIRVVYAVRSPVAAEKSLLVHWIKDWRMIQPDFDIIRMLHRNSEKPGERYLSVLERWASFSDVTLTLIPYFEDDSDGYASVDRFYEVVAGDRAPRLDEDFGSKRMHPSLPLASLKRLITIKKWARALYKLPLAVALLHRVFTHLLTADRSKSVARGFQERNAARGDWQLTPEEEAMIRKLYEPSYAAIRKTLGADIDSPDWRRWFAAEGM